MFFVKWPTRAGFKVEETPRKAIRRAKAMAKVYRRQVQIYGMGRTPPGTIGLVPGDLVAIVSPNGRIRASRGFLPGQGLGDAITDWACSSQDFAQNWAERVNAGINTGTQAAVLGAAAAGAIGGLINRPLIGAAVGAILGWGTHAIWTAPQRV